ncbi:MAG: Mini-ribonuclease 3 [Lachnospiraceae bacterium]
MEESINFKLFKETFSVEHKDASTYSPLALAYIGDAIFDVMIRTIEVSKVNKQVNKYHRDVSRIVCAPAQAKMITGILPLLTQEEAAIYKRGRNANSYSKAKNASRGEYRMATGFEAVLGYLYLKEDFSRLTEIVKLSLDVLDDKNEKAANEQVNK